MAIRTFNGISPILGQHVFVDDFAVVTGKVTLGDDVSVWPSASVRGDLLPIEIGARSNIQDGAVLHTTHANEYNAPNGFGLTIGSDVTVGHSVTLHGCTLHDQVLVGINAVILDDAVVEKHNFIAANTLVPPGKVLESGFLWMGQPAKKIRPLTDKEIAFFTYSAKKYVELKDLHLKTTS